MTLKRFKYKRYWIEMFLDNDNGQIKHYASIEFTDWVFSTKLFNDKSDAIQEAKKVIDEKWSTH